MILELQGEIWGSRAESEAAPSGIVFFRFFSSATKHYAVEMTIDLSCPFCQLQQRTFLASSTLLLHALNFKLWQGSGQESGCMRLSDSKLVDFKLKLPS